MKRIAVVIFMLAVFSGVSIFAACERTEGEPLDWNTLGYTKCDVDDDCLPLGYCADNGYCYSECRDMKDCWLFMSNEKDMNNITDESINYACIHHRCLYKCAFTDVCKLNEGCDCETGVSGEGGCTMCDADGLCPSVCETGTYCHKNGYCAYPKCTGDAECGEGFVCEENECTLAPVDAKEEEEETE